MKNNMEFLFLFGLVVCVITVSNLWAQPIVRRISDCTEKQAPTWWPTNSDGTAVPGPVHKEIKKMQFLVRSNEGHKTKTGAEKEARKRYVVYFRDFLMGYRVSGKSVSITDDLQYQKRVGKKIVFGGKQTIMSKLKTEGKFNFKIGEASYSVQHCFHEMSYFDKSNEEKIGWGIWYMTEFEVREIKNTDIHIGKILSRISVPADSKNLQCEEAFRKDGKDAVKKYPKCRNILNIAIETEKLARSPKPKKQNKYYYPDSNKRKLSIWEITHTPEGKIRSPYYVEMGREEIWARHGARAGIIKFYAEKEFERLKWYKPIKDCDSDWPGCGIKLSKIEIYNKKTFNEAYRILICDDSLYTRFGLCR